MAVLTEDRRIIIPNRSEDLPHLFELDDHPLAPPGHGRIIVWSTDMAARTLENVFLVGSGYNTKEGPESIGMFVCWTGCHTLNFAHSGFLKLSPRDYVFVHDSNEQDLESDVFVAVQVDRYTLVYFYSTFLICISADGWGMRSLDPYVKLRTKFLDL